MAPSTTQGGKKASKKTGDERFILEVAEFPELYNPFLPEYMDINKKILRLADDRYKAANGR